MAGWHDDTDQWRPSVASAKTTDVLLYDKVRWDHDSYEESLLEPIRAKLRGLKLSFQEIRYGSYREEEFRSAISQCQIMVFLCEHETQGIAYQQALSADVPILAWDRGGFWQDPSYYPHRVVYGPVTSVPYFDERCGERFKRIGEFEDGILNLLHRHRLGHLKPREYILESLTLEKSSAAYVEHAKRYQ